MVEQHLHVAVLDQVREFGQLIALSVILFFMTMWRRTSDFVKHAVLANVAIMTAGFLLMAYQLGGYYNEQKNGPAPKPAAQEVVKDGTRG